jgi:DNA-binding response OmpR family regulator
MKALVAGANDFISNPYDNAELRARINVGKRWYTANLVGHFSESPVILIKSTNVSEAEIKIFVYPY